MGSWSFLLSFPSLGFFCRPSSLVTFDCVNSFFLHPSSSFKRRTCNRSLFSNCHFEEFVSVAIIGVLAKTTTSQSLLMSLPEGFKLVLAPTSTAVTSWCAARSSFAFFPVIAVRYNWVPHYSHLYYSLRNSIFFVNDVVSPESLMQRVCLLAIWCRY